MSANAGAELRDSIYEFVIGNVTEIRHLISKVQRSKKKQLLFPGPILHHCLPQHPEYRPRALSAHFLSHRAQRSSCPRAASPVFDHPCAWISIEGPEMTPRTYRYLTTPSTSPIEIVTVYIPYIRNGTQGRPSCTFTEINNILRCSTTRAH
jgi:hypothetical protein